MQEKGKSNQKQKIIVKKEKEEEFAKKKKTHRRGDLQCDMATRHRSSTKLKLD